MKKYCYFAFCLSLVTSVCWSSSTKQDEYQMVWQDEFNCQNKLNSADWDHEQGFVRNHELQWYQQDNAFCDAGVLVIEGRRESKPTPKFQAYSDNWRDSRAHINYSSASVTTKGKHSWWYGHFEIRAKIRAEDGYGRRFGFLAITEPGQVKAKLI